jgi:hypothetical protein
MELQFTSVDIGYKSKSKSVPDYQKKFANGLLMQKEQIDKQHRILICAVFFPVCAS